MKHRLELFSDAVFAIIITVMLLEMRVPDAPGWRGWLPVLPSIAAYVVTFVFLLVMWAGHHHMFAHFREFNRRMYWLNGLALLFISLLPLSVHNFVAHRGDPTAFVVYLLLAWGAFNAFTGLRLAANATHRNDPGWKQWYARRNRTSLGGNVLQLIIVGVCFVSIPAAIVLWILMMLALIATI